jgi:outer membrane murein-binding lipoprotein Lpp
MKIDLNHKTHAEPREMAAITGEFTTLCTKAGHLQYQIDAFKKDVNLLNEQMRALNLEAAAAQVREKTNE